MISSIFLYISLFFLLLLLVIPLLSFSSISYPVFSFPFLQFSFSSFSSHSSSFLSFQFQPSFPHSLVLLDISLSSPCSSSSSVSYSISTSSFLFSPLFLSFLSSFFFLPLPFLYMPVWRFPQFSLSFPGSGAPRSRTLSIPDSQRRSETIMAERLPGGFSYWHSIRICACLLGRFFAKFGIAIGWFSSETKEPKLH